jgi:DMSO/TMAO reductase YedYZ heme-binding membrane subunit
MNLKKPKYYYFLLLSGIFFVVWQLFSIFDTSNTEYSIERIEMYYNLFTLFIIFSIILFLSNRLKKLYELTFNPTSPEDLF